MSNYCIQLFNVFFKTFIFCRHVLESDDNLLIELQRFGLMPDGPVTDSTLSVFSSLKNELVEFNRKIHNSDGASGNLGMVNSSTATNDLEVDENDEDDENPDFLLRETGVFDTNTGKLLRAPVEFSKNIASPEAWNQLVQKYLKRPTNALERDREAYYITRNKGKGLLVEDCRSEADLMMVQRQR